MARKLVIPDFDNLVRRYLAGESTLQLSQQFGIERSTVTNRLRSAGVKMRSMSDSQSLRFHGADHVNIRQHVPEILKEYRAGASVKELANRYGVSRTPVTAILRDQGLTIRGREGEALRTWWSRYKAAGGDPERVTGAAHRACRGRIMSLAEKRKRALTTCERLNNRGAYEDTVADALRVRGHKPRQQHPIGPYNVDVALPESGIAIEVLGRPLGGGNARRFAERTEYLLNRGWRILWVLCAWNGADVTPQAIAKHAIALAQFPRPDKPGRRQYRVIRGNGELLAGPSMDLQEIARILSPKSRRKTALH